MLTGYAEQFVVKAQLNVLPSMDNLRRWSIPSIGKCQLCGHPFPTLLHVLTNCDFVLRREEQELDRSENRYKWRHNCVLRTLGEAIKRKVSSVNKLPKPNGPPRAVEPITFVKAGASQAQRPAKRSARPQDRLGLLAEARDWICDFDLPEFHRPSRPFGLPVDVGAVNNRIDAFVLSRQSRLLVAGPELTVPMEENVEKQHASKMAKYGDMASSLAAGWRLHGLLCLEMGCRGVDPPSFRTVLRQLAFTPSEVHQLRDRCAYVARYCSYLIWLNRNKRDFVCSRVYYTAEGTFAMDERSLGEVRSGADGNELPGVRIRADNVQSCHTPVVSASQFRLQ